MADEWTRLKEKLFNQQIDAIGKETGEGYPQHQRAPLLDYFGLTGSQWASPPGQWDAPDHKQEQRPAKNQGIGAKNHQRIKQGMRASRRVDVLKEFIVQL